MVDSHHVMITAILLAVTVVGITGLYFTLTSSSGPNVVYLGGGPSYSGGSQALPLSRSFAVPRPFSVYARGLTGLSTMQQGTATINTSQIFDLRMPKNLILCSAEIFQDFDMAWLYTCGDANNTGGTIDCDPGPFGGVNGSLITPTTNLTCNATLTNITTANGAFVVCNAGSVGALDAKVINITIGGINASNITLDNIIYNSTSNDPGKGCVGLCNMCPFPDTDGCFKDPKGILFPTNVTECKFFDTSGQCLCECFSIHITDPDDVHKLKSGETLEFVVKKTIVTTTLNSSADCT